jgi:hypothetical protein
MGITIAIKMIDAIHYCAIISVACRMINIFVLSMFSFGFARTQLLVKTLNKEFPSHLSRMSPFKQRVLSVTTPSVWKAGIINSSA